MADLVITLKGDASDFKKQFDDAVKKLNDFGKSTSQATGYIGGMESQMKLLKTQMKSASESEIPAMRTQFLQLRTAIREAQYGTESFTKKIGGEFDAALNKAGKTLFGLGNVVKGVIGGFGIGAIAGSFVQATGAADALNKSIEDVVKSFNALGTTSIQSLINQTNDLFENVKKSRRELILQQIQNLQSVKDVTVQTFGSQFFGLEPDKRALTEEEKRAIWLDINALKAELNELDINALKAELNELDKSVKTTGGGATSPSPSMNNSPFYQALSESRTSSGYDAFVYERRQAEINARREASRQQLLENDKRIEKEEADRKAMEERIARARVALADRYSAGIAGVFEDAMSAGLQGGFQHFLANYMRQAGVRLFGGLIQLAISSATGGSFGIGSLIPKIFGFAGGGEFYTNGAMPIIVGDNPGGIEKVTVTPISGRGTTGLKNGNIALAGGGSVTSMPMGGNTPEIIFRPIIKFDGYDIAYSLEMPNGGYEKLNRARGN